VTTSGLSGAVRRGDLVIVTAVLDERGDGCEAVQVLVATSSVGAAVRSLHRSGYRRAGTRLGTMAVDDADADLATGHPGQVFERFWPAGDQWRPAGYGR